MVRKGSPDLSEGGPRGPASLLSGKMASHFRSPGAQSGPGALRRPFYSTFQNGMQKWCPKWGPKFGFKMGSLILGAPQNGRPKKVLL